MYNGRSEKNSKAGVNRSMGDGWLQPTGQKERIITLDIVRGFALLGILLVNMQFFVSPQLFLTITGIRLFEDPLSIAADWFITIFAAGKFMPIFSFLFGLGFFLFMERVKEKGLSVGKLFSKRLWFLLLLGMIHIFIFWSGDILLNYALAGFLLLFFRNSSVEKVKKWAIGMFLFVIFLLSLLTFLSALAENFAEQANLPVQDFTHLIDESIIVFQNGSFAEILAFRQDIELPIVLFNYVVTIPMVLAIFLIGLYVGKKGVLFNIAGHLDWIRKVWKNSLIFGALLTIPYVVFKAEIAIVPFYFHEGVVQNLSLIVGLLICFFYTTSIVLLCQNDNWKKRLLFLAPVGQMALTNYLMQTLICISLFYGYGLGFYGRVSPFLGIVITILIFVGQVFFSKWWLSKYKYGPLERLWRWFTYKGVN